MSNQATSNQTVSNQTIELLQNHRVYREFDSSATVPDSQLNDIIKCAQQAPSWQNGQHYSIINISDKALRQKIVDLQPRNPQIAQCSVFLVFVMDGYRSYLSSEAYDGSFEGFKDSDTLITLATDTALAAQNATVAAESLGYATCPIGGLRMIANDLIELLQLPKYTYPIFGLCIGKPSVEMCLKPRLPKSAVYFDNQYQVDALPQMLADYEQTILAFNEARERKPYRQKFADYYSQPYVAAAEDWLKAQGFLTKQK